MSGRKLSSQEIYPQRVQGGDLIKVRGTLVFLSDEPVRETEGRRTGVLRADGTINYRRMDL